ncbi:BOI-related E3 ubiquitin-protein ligase 1-like protein [Drosera capensis]
MAVQARYPSSNMLLFNRNGQDGKDTGIGNDYSLLQPHQGSSGGFVLDHSSQMLLFNNGVVSNQKKRGREPTVDTANTTTTSAANINPLNFSLHNNSNHPHQLQQNMQIIDLSQLPNNQLHQHRQSNVVSTGLRLSFGENQQQNLPQNSSVMLSLLSDEFANQIKQQSDELNQFIIAQGEQLRRTIAEKRTRNYRALLTIAEERATRKLREKETEIEKSHLRNTELEARVAHLAAEAQAWQAKARSQEAQAASLQSQIHQAMMMNGGDGGRGDAAAAAEDAESCHVDPEREIGGGGPGCRLCRRRAATVVVLPCRHLCLCPACDALVHACPLCLSLRNGGVEVLLS